MSIPATDRIYLGSTYVNDYTGVAAGPFGLSQGALGPVVTFTYRGEPSKPYTVSLDLFRSRFSPVQCAGCTGLQPFERSCGCFDNGGE
jgi:hypothetical protein